MLAAMTWSRFQSTPPSGERSDPDGYATGNTDLSFNPRPPPERGATDIVRTATLGDFVSIHAPLRREERQSDSAEVV